MRRVRRIVHGSLEVGGDRIVRLALHSIAYEAKTLNLAKEGYTAFYVDGTNGLDIHDGGSWGQAFKTIQHAVDEAGSWCKIFIKAGTYAENVVIASQGINLVGEKRGTVIVKPVSGRGISSTGDHTTVEAVTAVGNGSGANAAIYFIGKYGMAKNLVVGNQATNGYGAIISGDHGVCDGVSIDSGNRPGSGVWVESYHGSIKNCILENVRQDAIVLAELACYWNNVYDNTIIDAGRYGIYINGAGCDYNTIFHNNVINSVTANVRDATGANNKFFENFYDDHIVDINNVGVCDTPYSFTNGIDYQPVSKRNGWKQECLGYAAGQSGGEFRKLTKSITLTTAAVPVTENLFTVTGEVECSIMGYVDTTVTSAGALTMKVGVLGDSDGFIVSTGKAALLANLMWVDSAPSVLEDAPQMKIVANGSDIRHTIETASALTGAITYYCWWRPLSSDGNVVAA